MDSASFLKGQRVTTPEGSEEVVEVIGDKVVVKLDSGGNNTFPYDDVTDDISAG